MADNRQDLSAPTPSTVSPRAENTPPPVTQVEAASRRASRSPQISQSTGRKRRIHPLWLAAAVAALFGLVFGVGAITSGVANASVSTSSAPSGTTIEAQTIAVIQMVSPSVVQIQGRSTVGSGGSVGSGEILTKDGYIVTNDHVVHGFSNLSALLSNGQQVPARLIGEAPSEDLAVVKISAGNLKPIAVGNSDRVQVGEFALALGSPLGLEQSATSGIISALNRDAHTQVDGRTLTLSGLIQTSAPINPGNSGGALVNLQGQLIGIPTLGAIEPATGVSANGIGFAISSNHMQTIVRQLTSGAA